MGDWLILSAAALFGLSGLPGLFCRPNSGGAERLAAALSAAAAACGLTGAALCFASPDLTGLALPWQVPGGSLRIVADGLSLVFLLPVLLLPTLGSFYGLSYWSQAEHPDNGRQLRFFYGLLTSAMILVTVARNAILFLTAWETMALAAFFLVTTEDHQPEVRKTGLLYLVTANLGTLCLIAFFGLLRHLTGTFDLGPIPAGALSPQTATTLFALALVGFGLKAGVMPLHVWLPGAHANSPSHVSAVLSGVVLKLGVFGLVRMLGFFPTVPVAWGAVVLALGAGSGVLGVVFAIGQHDLKRLLAYHSIENIGIICLGVGLALLGRATGRPAWVFLGLGGALLHVWNHALFKSLLFLSAGSVLHAAHTRDIDRLGGLLRRMPYTGTAFLVGAAAICGLPPLNGFVSELLIYLGLFRAVVDPGTTWAASALSASAAPALALIGALAVACFVKVFGAAFLGEPRTPHAAEAREAPSTMLGPMAVLAGLCAFIGLAPTFAAPLLNRAVGAWTSAPGTDLAGLAPLRSVSAAGLALVGTVAVLALVVRHWLRTRPVGRAVTWDCGYAAPSATMQYTSSSFAEMLVGLFSWVLCPEVRRPRRPALFEPSASFESHVPDVVLDRGLYPALGWAARLASAARLLHQGRIQAYVLYIFVALLGLLLWL